MLRKDMKNEILKEFKPISNPTKIYSKCGYMKLENRGKRYCGCCGNQLVNVNANKCSCGAKLNDINKTYSRTKTYCDYPNTSMYFQKSCKIADWLVIRTFVMWNRQEIGKKATDIKCYEVMRLAIDQKGNKVFARIDVHQCMWNWDWTYGTDFAIKKFADKFDLITDRVDFTSKPDFCKYFDINAHNEINKSLRYQHDYPFNYLRLTITDTISYFANDNKFFETLTKLGRYDLLGLYISMHDKEDYKDCLFTLARKNKAIPCENWTNYIDYINACKELNKDLKNIDILCPTDFENADRLVQRKLAKIKAEKEAKKRIEDNKKYIERVHNLIDKDFGNDKYSIQIIPSVKDFYYEGKINFKNCCYSMEYFKKESSLVFIVYIRENMKRCEMAELQLNNKKQLVINQCYGACNKHTENHDEITSLLAQQSKMIKQTYLRG